LPPVVEEIWARIVFVTMTDVASVVMLLPMRPLQHQVGRFISEHAEVVFGEPVGFL
jgi:hypothetical protein